jgi:protein-disulfide isomerase
MKLTHLVSAAAVAAMAAIVVAPVLAKPAAKPAAAPGPALTDMALGNPKAPVVVIEYAAVSCPHCAHWNEEYLPTLKAKHIDTGQVRYILRETPIHGAIDVLGYRVARCGGPSKYFTVVDNLFKGQNAYLFKDENNPDGLGWLVNAGVKSGLTEAQVKACISDKAADAALDKRDTDLSNANHIEETPTFVVDGKKIDEPTPAKIEAAIAAAAAGRR